MFGFEDCYFAVQKNKETTARVVMWREFSLVNSYTLEVSFLGPNRGENAGTHFNTKHLQTIGRVFCKTLADYASDLDRVNQALVDLRNRFPQGGVSVRRNNKYNNKID